MIDEVLWNLLQIAFFVPQSSPSLRSSQVHNPASCLCLPIDEDAVIALRDSELCRIRTESQCPYGIDGSCVCSQRLCLELVFLLAWTPRHSKHRNRPDVVCLARQTDRRYGPLSLQRVSNCTRLSILTTAADKLVVDLLGDQAIAQTTCSSVFGAMTVFRCRNCIVD